MNESSAKPAPLHTELSPLNPNERLLLEDSLAIIRQLLTHPAITPCECDDESCLTAKIRNIIVRDAILYGFGEKIDDHHLFNDDQSP